PLDRRHQLRGIHDSIVRRGIPGQVTVFGSAIRCTGRSGISVLVNLMGAVAERRPLIREGRSLFVAIFVLPKRNTVGEVRDVRDKGGTNMMGYRRELRFDLY